VSVRVLFQSCLLAAGVLLFAGCAEPDPVVETPVQVEAGPPAIETVALKLRYPIELEADEEVAITPVAISGFLRKVVVDVGDQVDGGQLIALVDCREYAAQRVQAETAIAKWEAQVDESASQLNRLTRMGDKLVAPAEIERARADARVAEAELADARAKLSEAGQRTGYCSLRAPFSGFVANRYLDVGAMVTPGGTPVVSIVKTHEVRVVASVTEQDAPQIMRGAPVELEFHAFPDTVFRAEVVRIGRSLDEKTRTLRVEMKLPNTTEALLPGMTGHAWIAIGKREGAMLVPSTAVLRLEESAFAYVVRDKDKPRAERVQVELGVDHGDWVEVLSGIEKDDVVIMTGRELVDNDTWVEITEPTQKFEEDGGPGKKDTDEDEADEEKAEDEAQAAESDGEQAAGDDGPASDGEDTGGSPKDGRAAEDPVKAKADGSEPSTKKRGKKGNKDAEPEPLPVKPAPLPTPEDNQAADAAAPSASRAKPGKPSDGPT
jgi:membrane fusion protein (multidrug efflux system)